VGVDAIRDDGNGREIGSSDCSRTDRASKQAAEEVSNGRVTAGCAWPIPGQELVAEVKIGGDDGSDDRVGDDKTDFTDGKTSDNRVGDDRAGDDGVGDDKNNHAKVTDDKGSDDKGSDDDI
jgi:hypothetical protein